MLGLRWLYNRWVRGWSKGKPDDWDIFLDRMKNIEAEAEKLAVKRAKLEMISRGYQERFDKLGLEDEEERPF